MSLTIPVRTWAQTVEDARRFREVEQIILAYLHPDSYISRDQVLDRIVRLVELADEPTQIGGVRFGTPIP